MTKFKSTKRALLASALALILCVSMLVGSTFAWFTDSVTTAGNTIQSGTLKIDLVDANDKSMEGQVIEFVTADGRDQDKILWEPGCTYETEPVYVINNGNLALKYVVNINGINGDAKLLEAIEWTVTVDGKETDLSTFEGTLIPGETEKSGAIVLSGHMKEKANNDYQGLTAEGISITVYATQLTHEYDSEDNQYDKVGAIGGGRIEYTGSRWQIAADFAATGVKTLAANVVDANGNIITTVTPETFAIPEDGVLGDPADGSQYSWKTICAAVTGDSSSWQNTKFVPSMGVVPARIELVINGAVVDVCAVTYGVDLWAEAVKASKIAHVNSADGLQAALTEGKDVVLTGDITLTKKLKAVKDVVIDLNGYTVDGASIPEDTLFQSSSDTDPSMIITSSVAGAKINAGGKSVLLGYGSTEISNVEINVGEIKSSSYTTFKVYGDLTLGEGTVVNVDYLGTSLISNSGKIAIDIDGAKINVGTFKVNSSAMISLTSGTTLALNDTEVTVGLDTTYTSYFISKAENATIGADCTFNVTSTDSANYGIELKPDASVGAKYVWVQK